MPLITGFQLDSYEIIALLGAGGMGEVYRARDAALKRDVAIKVLPAECSRDIERLRRFDLEAQAAAALNHPNIVSIFHVGRYDGSPYIVTELLQGETLRERLRKGPMRLREVLDYGVELARGLAAAHDAGIVHRDLKPENIWITKDGRIKILDFGLAKLNPAKAVSLDGITVSFRQESVSGHVLGTVGYMSPEQVRGEVADARSDIFAVGVVLYEMLTGKSAFRKATLAETMTAILNEDPPSVSQIAPSVPPGLQRIVNRCLAKNPAQRFQHATDLEFALEALSDSGTGSQVTGAHATVSSVRRRGIAASAAVLVIATIGYATYSVIHRRIAPPFLNYDVIQVTYGNALVAAITPDGRFVAIAKQDRGQESLWLHNVATNTDVQIAPGEEVGYGCINFSPDGNFIFACKSTANTTGLYRAPLLGGTWQMIAKNVGSSAAVSPDGKRIAYMRPDCPQQGHWCVVETDPEGTRETVLYSQTGNNRPNDYNWPLSDLLAWSPDGKQLAAAVTEAGNGSTIVDVIDADTGSSRELFSVTGKAIRTLDWLPEGHGFLVNFATKDSPHRWQVGFLSYPKGNLRAVTNDTNSYFFDRTSSDGRSLAAGMVTGDVRKLYLLPQRGSNDRSPPPVALPVQAVTTFSWDRDGSLLLAGDGKFVRAGIDGHQVASLLRVAGALTARAPVPCDAGRYLVFECDYRGGAGGVNVWRMNPDGSNLVQLTTGSDGEDPVCAQKGPWVYYKDATRPQPMRIPIDGGQAEPVPGSAVPNGSYRWGNFGLSPDGERLVYMAIVKVPGGASTHLGAAIVNLRSEGREAARLVELDQRISLPPQFTPDGSAIAYPIRENGVDNIWVQPLNGQPKHRITNFSSDTTHVFYWSPDGKTLGLVRRHTESDAVVLAESRSSQ